MVEKKHGMLKIIKTFFVIIILKFILVLFAIIFVLAKISKLFLGEENFITEKLVKAIRYLIKFSINIWEKFK